MSPKSKNKPTPSPFSWEELRRDLMPITVVGLATAVIAFAQWGDAYDRHWTSAWLIMSALTVGLAATRMIRLSNPLFWGIGMAMLIGQAIRGGDARWEVLAMWTWLWTWFWTVPVEGTFFWRGFKALPLFAATIGGFMLLHALKSMWNGEWGHGASYVMTLPWAHRNIGMEAMFAMCVLGGFISGRKWYRWWGFIVLLAFLYQVRGVMLASALWALYVLWQSEYVTRWMKRGAVAACALFICAQVLWNMLPFEQRVERFKKVPDVVKSLDVVYNLNGAESSSIRLTLWRMTGEQISALGAGLASWRDDAEGFINVATGRCGEATRRAHSELLQWSYELGWLPLMLLVGLCWPLRRSMLRWVWFALPFLAFTFPTERAEILWPFAMLGWWLKLQFPPEDKELRLPPHVLTAIQTAACVLFLSWFTAQNAIGQVLRGTGTLRANWSAMQEFCLSLHPEDIALNHVDIVRAMSEYNQGRPQSGAELVNRNLEDHPLSIPAIRVHLKSRGQPNDADAICQYLSTKIASGEIDPALNRFAR